MTLSTAPVAAWHADVDQLGDPAQVLLIAHNQTVASLNQTARSRMEETAQLYGPTIPAGTRRLQAGDRVVNKESATTIGVNNGDLATIINIDTESATYSSLVRSMQCWLPSYIDA